MSRKGPETSLGPVLSSTFIRLLVVFTTSRGSCSRLALRNFGTGWVSLVSLSSSSFSIVSFVFPPPGVSDRWVLWGWPRKAELPRQDVRGIGSALVPQNRIILQIEMKEKIQYCFSYLSEAVVQFWSLASMFVFFSALIFPTFQSLESRPSHLIIFQNLLIIFPTFQPLSFFSNRFILGISGLKLCSSGRFVKSPPPLLISSSLHLKTWFWIWNISKIVWKMGTPYLHLPAFGTLKTWKTSSLEATPSAPSGTSAAQVQMFSHQKIHLQIYWKIVLPSIRAI